MIEKDKNIFPKMDLLPHPLKAVGRCVVYLFEKHQLASHGDHLFEHPLDEPVEQVTDWPGQPYTYPDTSQMTLPYYE